MLGQQFQLAFSLCLFTCVSSFPPQYFDNMDGNITECPTWYILQDGKCVCGGGDINCIVDEQVTLHLLHCMTYTNHQVLLGNCPYSMDSAMNGDYTPLPKNVSELNEFMCGGRNRTGLLCSQCRDNLTLAALSYTRECIECSDAYVRKGIVLFLVLAFIPTTAFFLIVMVCSVNIFSGPMIAVVTILQVNLADLNRGPPIFIVNPANDLHIVAVLVTIFFGIWNLDFLRFVIPPFCISKSLTSLQAQLLEYAIAIYPLLVIIITYICVELHDQGNCLIVKLGKPFRTLFRLKCLKYLNIRYSLITTFATFFLLAYTRIFFISSGILHYNPVTNVTGNTVKTVLYMDASVEYGSTTHIPYVVLAICMFVIFNLLPILLLFLYPTKCFQHLLGCFPNVNWHPLRAFMDIFQGCYKNGTDGTRDCRYFAALNFVIRIILLYPNNINLLKTVTVPIIFSYMLLSTRPYRRNILNHWDSFVFYFYGLIVLLTYISYTLLFTISYFLYVAILFLYVLLLLMKALFPGCYARCLKKAENCELARKLLSLKSDVTDVERGTVSG